MTQSSAPRPTPLRKLAEGQPCQIRLPGICNRREDTTVLCHYRGEATGSGYGLKPHDIFGAWGCSACHAYVDSHFDYITQLAFAHGVFRTQQKLIDMEKLNVGSTD